MLGGLTARGAGAKPAAERDRCSQLGGGNDPRSGPDPAGGGSGVGNPAQHRSAARPGLEELKTAASAPETRGKPSSCRDLQRFQPLSSSGWRKKLPPESPCLSPAGKGPLRLLSPPRTTHPASALRAASSPAPASPLLRAFLCSPSWAQQLLLFLRIHMAHPCWESRLPAPSALSGPASAALRPEGGDRKACGGGRLLPGVGLLLLPLPPLAGLGTGGGPCPRVEPGRPSGLRGRFAPGRGVRCGEGSERPAVTPLLAWCFSHGFSQSPVKI